MARISVGRRITRAIFQGMTIGIFGGTGLYLMAQAVNTFAGSTVFNPVAFLLLGMGGATTAAVGIELSSDIASDIEQK